MISWSTMIWAPRAPDSDWLEVAEELTQLTRLTAGPVQTIFSVVQTTEGCDNSEEIVVLIGHISTDKVLRHVITTVYMANIV